MSGDVDQLYEQSLGQLRELLDSERVVGEPIETAGGTVIPLFSTGFGFGAGEGSDAEGAGGGGAGAGGGIKPVSVIIVSEEGVRVHRLTEADALERLADAGGRAIDRLADRYGGRRAESEATGTRAREGDAADALGRERGDEGTS